MNTYYGCLKQEDVKLFYKLWYFLAHSVNCKHKIVPQFKEPKYGDVVFKEPFAKIKKELWENPEFIDEFLAENGSRLFMSEQSILKSWRTHFVKSEFIICKYFNRYSVFMSRGKKPKLYGVKGISDPIETIIRAVLPIQAEAVLLPFKGKIIYDSILMLSPIEFSLKKQKTLMESYEKAKAESGIIKKLG